MVKVPLEVQPDDVFEIVLDCRLFTVICPLDADGGDTISLLAPAPRTEEDPNPSILPNAIPLPPLVTETAKSKGAASLPQRTSADGRSRGSSGSGSGSSTVFLKSESPLADRLVGLPATSFCPSLSTATTSHDAAATAVPTTTVASDATTDVVTATIAPFTTTTATTVPTPTVASATTVAAVTTTTTTTTTAAAATTASSTAAAATTDVVTATTDAAPTDAADAAVADATAATTDVVTATTDAADAITDVVTVTADATPTDATNTTDAASDFHDRMTLTNESGNVHLKEVSEEQHQQTSLLVSDARIALSSSSSRAVASQMRCSELTSPTSIHFEAAAVTGEDKRSAPLDLESDAVILSKDGDTPHDGSTGTVCRLCTFYNEHPCYPSNCSNSNSNSDSDSSGDYSDHLYSTQTMFCKLCGEDLRGGKSPPVAVPIPLASPSLTVISSLRSIHLIARHLIPILCICLWISFSPRSFYFS